MASLTLRGVAKRFGAVTALDGFDLHVPDGTAMALLGASGCGKSTALRMLAGFEAPDAGRVEIDGEIVADGPVCRPPEARQLAMVFQSYALWPHRTALDNVAWPLRLRSRPEPEATARRALQRVGLADLAGRLPHQLSGGQQQRVALARALAGAPRAVLLDEPLSALDTQLRASLGQDVRRLCAEDGRTVVVVTHDLDEAFLLADAIALVDAGRVVEHGAPEELARRPRRDLTVRAFGPMSLLRGVRTGAGVALSGRLIPCHATDDAPTHGSVDVAIRPYGAQLSDDGLAGRVVSRASTSTGWNVDIDTDVGRLSLASRTPVAVGAATRVRIEASFALNPARGASQVR